MTYPRIFSLSTVGILKHYVHDYLFHPLRTDFIGPNGVGKSIIADLLQLMFVYDTSLIRFGTDGVKKDERSIYKLPYGLATAYCFLNVEVEKGQFIIIGIVLPSQTSVRITPFVITRTAELERDLSELTFSADMRLFAKDILEEGNVPDLKALANKLFSNRQLYLTSFRTKDDTKRYYSFLYDKQILSINLGIDDHLNAFAKVIQSFSKAKSLDLSPAKASKSLKTFLFDDSDLGLEGEYKRQQAQLEKLLSDYASLDIYIRGLRSKQSRLTDLNKKNERLKEADQRHVLGKISMANTSIRQSENSESALKDELEKLRVEKETLNQMLTELPEKQRILKEKLETSINFRELHRTYQLATEKEEQLRSDLTNLKIINPPNISVEWSEIESQYGEERSVLEIKQIIAEASPYLKKFTSPLALERAFDAQKENIGSFHQTIKKRIGDIDGLIHILSHDSGDSVLGWGLTHSEKLTPVQQCIVMYYATGATIPPLVPRQGDRYFDPQLLMDSYVEKSSDGFWLQLGAVNEFIVPGQNGPSPFVNTIENQSINELVVKLTTEKENLKLQMQELDLIQRGSPYNRSILDHDYDPFLATYDNIRRVQTAAALINSLRDRILKTEEQYSLALDKVKDIRSRLPSEIVYNEPEVVEKELKVLSDRALENYKKCCQEETALKEKLKQAELSSENQRRQLIDLASLISSCNVEKEKLCRCYRETYERTPEDDLSTLQLPDLSQLENELQIANQDYQIKYVEIVGLFPETNNQRHAGVNREVNQKSFDFEILEEALLAKIKHTDSISIELENANRNRMNMADEIKNTMVLIFNRTVEAFKQYKTTVYTLNQFFQGIKISNRFFFSINFAKDKQVQIEILEDIGSQVRNAAKRGELAFDKPVGDFIEDFFKRAAQLKEIVTIDKLLDPKTFFDLSISLTDEYGVEIPGSTGETYSAIALLGIARLSLVQKHKRRGLRFIILEELGSLDTVNFNTFPAIAREFSYQIITMAPSPFRSNLDDEWYAHHLIKGLEDKNINYAPSASYFKTKDGNQELVAYLKLQEP